MYRPTSGWQTPQEDPHLNVHPLLPVSSLPVSLNPQPVSIYEKVFIKMFCKSHVWHKSVDFFFISTNIKNKLTDLCGNRLLQNDLINTLCEMSFQREICPRRGSDRPASVWMPPNRGGCLYRVILVQLIITRYKSLPFVPGKDLQGSGPRIRWCPLEFHSIHDPRSWLRRDVLAEFNGLAITLSI